MMNLAKLRHVVRVAASLAPDRRLVLFGSMCAVVRYPDLAEHTKLYAVTNDADFITDPWSEDLAVFLSKVMGRETLFSGRFGCYADFVRPAAFDQFPPGFEERLVPIQDVENVFAIDIHDMAVAKLWAGRPKDIALLSALLYLRKLDEVILRKRLWDTPMEEKWIVKTHNVLDQIVAEAKRLTESGVSAQELEIPAP